MQDTTKFLAKQVPHGYWSELSNQRSLLNILANKWNISNLDGWYNISSTAFKQHDEARSLLYKYNGSISKLLSTVYPEYLHSNSLLQNNLDHYQSVYVIRINLRYFIVNNISFISKYINGMLRSLFALHVATGMTQIIKESSWMNSPKS